MSPLTPDASVGVPRLQAHESCEDRDIPSVPSEVRVRRVEDDPKRGAAEIKALRGIWADTGGGTDELLEERRRERELEERKAQRWGVDQPRRGPVHPGARGGYDPALATVAMVRKRLDVIDPDWSIVEAAAKIKADGGLSYAVAFCIATAVKLDAPLWTGDPEIVGQADRGSCRVIDLRDRH